MAFCDDSIFDWMSQSQLMPVWEEYPPPFTAYESFNLELDRYRYFGSIDHRMESNGDEKDSHSSIPFLPLFESSILKNNELAYVTDADTPSSIIPEPFSGTNSGPSSPSNSFHYPKPEIVAESPPPNRKSRSAMAKLPEFSIDSIPEILESSDFSEDMREEESEVDMSDEEESGRKRKNSFNGSDDGDGKKEDSHPKKRQRTTPEQLEVLEKVYEQEKLPGSDLRKELAAKLKMTPRRVQVWFQNKRAKEKRIGVSPK